MNRTAPEQAQMVFREGALEHQQEWRIFLGAGRLISRGRKEDLIDIAQDLEAREREHHWSGLLRLLHLRVEGLPYLGCAKTANVRPQQKRGIGVAELPGERRGLLSRQAGSQRQHQREQKFCGEQSIHEWPPRSHPKWISRSWESSESLSLNGSRI